MYLQILVHPLLQLLEQQTGLLYMALYVMGEIKKQSLAAFCFSNKVFPPENLYYRFEVQKIDINKRCK